MWTRDLPLWWSFSRRVAAVLTCIQQKTISGNRSVARRETNVYCAPIADYSQKDRRKEWERKKNRYFVFITRTTCFFNDDTHMEASVQRLRTSCITNCQMCQLWCSKKNPVNLYLPIKHFFQHNSHVLHRGWSPSHEAQVKLPGRQERWSMDDIYGRFPFLRKENHTSWKPGIIERFWLVSNTK